MPREGTPGDAGSEAWEEPRGDSEEDFLGPCMFLFLWLLSLGRKDGRVPPPLCPGLVRSQPRVCLLLRPLLC